MGIKNHTLNAVGDSKGPKTILQRITVLAGGWVFPSTLCFEGEIGSRIKTYYFCSNF